MPVKVPTNKHGYIIPVLFNMGHCSNLYCPEQMILNPLIDATAGEMILVWASWMACIWHACVHICSCNA